MVSPAFAAPVHLRHAAVCASLFLAVAAAGEGLFREAPEEASPDLQFFVRGMAWGDYDNDGWTDILCASDSRLFQMALMRNEGGGRFSERPGHVRMEHDPHQPNGAGVLFGDYDNDGDLDLFLSVGGPFADRAGVNRLLRNDRGQFTDVTAEAGMTRRQATDGAIWMDYDRDGFIDLYTINVGWFPDDPTQRNRLYRNKGDGSFADVTGEAGLLVQFHEEMGGALASAADLNEDGYPDLFVVPMPTDPFREGPVEEQGEYPSNRNKLFLSDGQGAFRDATVREITTEGAGAPATMGDLDNDGDLDLFAPSGRPLDPGLEFRSLLLLNVGGGEFLDFTDAAGLAVLSNVGAGAPYLRDLDNDGDLDLLIFGSALNRSPHFLFLNDGEGVFTEATPQLGIVPGMWGSFGDPDRDGFLDLLEYGSPFYRNTGNAFHWTQVELVGVESNRNGIGARVLVTAGGVRQMREISGGTGFGGQEEMMAHFGLGQRTLVDELEVRWPSGGVDVMTDVPVDQRIRVIEGRDEYHVVVPTAWEHNLPDSVTAGATTGISMTVRPALFDPGAQITSVVADLSHLGGPTSVPMTAQGDGTYVLDASVAVETSGYAEVSIDIEQFTALGSHWIGLSKTVAVLPAELPAEDLVLLDEEIGPGISMSSSIAGNDLELPRATNEGPVFRGNLAVACPVAYECDYFSDWGVRFELPEPVNPLEYAALAFALHPGDTRPPLMRGWLPGVNMFVSVNDRYIRLAGRDPLYVDMNLREWQPVVIPLAEWNLNVPIRSIGFDGQVEGTFYVDDVRLVVSPATAVVEDHTQSLPRVCALDQNYPNPFNSGTVIGLDLPDGRDVELSVYNLAGQRVVKLVDGWREAGTYTLRWDGRDGGGRELASGVYLCRLAAGDQVRTRRLLLLR